MLATAIERESSPVLKLSAFCGACYLAASATPPLPGMVLIKALSIATLAYLAWKAGAGMLALGLAASTIGDVLLDRPVNLFVPGLVMFLLAHVSYAIFFVGNWDLPLRVWERQRVLVLTVCVYSLLFTIWLAPSLGPLTIPVAFYICAITSMVVAAILARPRWLVIAGALLFLASDSLLAIAKFKQSFPFRDFLVWGTYYFAQYFITTGSLGIGWRAAGWRNPSRRMR